MPQKTFKSSLKPHPLLPKASHCYVIRKTNGLYYAGNRYCGYRTDGLIFSKNFEDAKRFYDIHTAQRDLAYLNNGGHPLDQEDIMKTGKGKFKICQVDVTYIHEKHETIHY
jgi:hypothetical protein